jgi:hypothetical protein
MSFLLRPANNDAPSAASARSPRILEWLTRLATSDFTLADLLEPFDRLEKFLVAPDNDEHQRDDWQNVAHICGYRATDFLSAKAPLPLTAAEIDHFRRNHRCAENHVSRDFMTARADLPSPLAELYGLYRHRARLDTEAALFVAQTTGSTRVARLMADLLCIGAFANGLEYVSYMGISHSVPAAFDSSDLIDHANREAARRLALPADHPSHLLTLTPDAISVIAADIVENHALHQSDFLEKANLLSEARQDVTRLPACQHFTTAIIERDLPLQRPWVIRLSAAYFRILPGWVSDLPEIQASVQ